MTNSNIKDFSSKGGLARAKKLSPSERKVISAIAIKARWDRYREKNNHVCNNMCRCSNCGRMKYKHVSLGELCADFLCETLG